MLHVMFGNTLIMSAEWHILTNASYCGEKKICSLSNSVFFFFFFLKPCQDVFGRTRLVLVSAFKLRGLQKRPDVSTCPAPDFLYPQSLFVFRLPPSAFPGGVNTLAGS